MSSVVRMKRRVSTFYLCVVDNKCAELSDLLPGIMNQLGPDNIDHLKQLADNLSNSNKSTSMGEEHDDGDEDVPDLVENFEDVSKS
jgi:nascent polypeptide-associated complex subunit beta|mmetsp:Transcript_20716/g.54282  ORF Transcript_20716/g.54282 Transcript_20716/m.54282 type:complete len:86 (-) Transcript_20716:437-694(-)